MTDYEKVSQINVIYEKLQDVESKRIFEARVSYMIYGDRIRYWDRIKEGKKWYALNLKEKEYYIFGAGTMGLHIKEQLEMVEKQVKAFLDNDPSKIGQSIRGVPVLRAEDAGICPEIPIIFSSRQYEDQMREQLIELNIKNPVMKEEELCLFCGVQYFDVFKANKHEVLIDAGAYDGGTVKDFIQWCEGGYDKIYSFEPDFANYEKCKSFIERNHIERIHLLQKGTFDTERIVHFDMSGDGGASVKADGASIIETTAIDQVLNGKRATFIKMDVEGSEIESIHGAKDTIEKYKPRMAVCIYHKPLDFIEIPLELLKINPAYKFYIRHYASNLCETVLYAESYM